MGMIPRNLVAKCMVDTCCFGIVGRGVEIYGSGGRVNIGLRWHQGLHCGLGILVWVGIGMGRCLFEFVPSENLAGGS